MCPQPRAEGEIAMTSSCAQNLDLATDELRSGFVLSDLHLFTRRSMAAGWEGDIARAASAGDFLVFNGDIVDFRWSTLPSVGDTIDAAVRWLDHWLVAYPRCRFYYVMGNHDGLAEFGQRLELLSRLRPNLVWHPSAVCIGSALFLHGDLPLRLGRGRSLRGPLPEVLGQHGRLADDCYQLATAARLPRAAVRIHARRRTVAKVERALQADPPYALGPVTDVYFGHTHLPFARHRHGGLTFHNSGSAIRGMDGGLLPVDLREPVPSR
jgi:UDP-2,3-diacylglucosamine hydrolase